MKLHDLLLRDRTIRKFMQIPVEDFVIDAIMKNVRLAHSTNNLQRLRYFILLSADKVEAAGNMVHFAARLPREIGEPKDGEKPMAFIVIVIPTGLTGNIEIDVGIAAEIISASASEQGVGACMIQNFDKPGVNALLKLENSQTARLVIALGYPLHTSQVVDADNGETAYICNPIDYSYRVPKLSVEQISSRL